jgi:hypothetical protein
MNEVKVTVEGKLHSPLPWFLSGREGGWFQIQDTDGNEIADVNYSNGLDEPTLFPERANGQLIVTAVNERDALLSEVAQLRDALASAAIPYEALLMDAESRRWIAPEVWSAIEDAQVKARIALEGNNNNVQRRVER